jgi:DnaJ like chaperone protein
MTCRIITTILGFFFGGPMGGIIGFFIGSFLDQSVKKNNTFTGGSAGPGPSPWNWRQTFNQPFVRSVFILMGYLAKADGQITSNEIRIAAQAMTQLHLTDQQRHQAMRWFYDGKNQQFDPAEIFQKLWLYRQPIFMRILLTCLTNIAYANGDPSATQQKILQEICAKLEIPAPQAQQHYSYSSAGQGDHSRQQNTASFKNSLNSDYRLMGLKAEADIDTIRKTYRRLMSKHHPDKLSAKGASEQEIKAASEKVCKIRRAYENVMRSKGVTV